MTGKGSAPRPLSVSEEEFGKRFDAIDWSHARGGHPMPEPKPFVGEMVVMGVRTETWATGTSDDFGVIAVDSE